MIKNIIFDLGGVLVRLDKDLCIKAFAEIGHPDFGRIINEYFQEGFFMDYEKGLISIILPIFQPPGMFFMFKSYAANSYQS